MMQKRKKGPMKLGEHKDFTGIRDQDMLRDFARDFMSVSQTAYKIGKRAAEVSKQPYFKITQELKRGPTTLKRLSDISGEKEASLKQFIQILKDKDMVKTQEIDGDILIKLNPKAVIRISIKEEE